MEQCCTGSYNKMFDTKTAEKELRSYLKSGPKKTTNLLVNFLKQQSPQGKTLLDIGGGIGAIDFELIKSGIAHTSYIDISDGYRQVFQKEVARKNMDTSVQIFSGDFLEASNKIQQTDIVTLDKVICCYADYENLVTQSLAKAKTLYAYIIPRDNWWVKMVHTPVNKLVKTFGLGCETFIHPEKEIERIITDNGFTRIYEQNQFQWSVNVFEKVQNQ